jgi:hypothetical protein
MHIPGLPALEVTLVLSFYHGTTERQREEICLAVTSPPPLDIKRSLWRGPTILSSRTFLAVKTSFDSISLSAGHQWRPLSHI